MRTKLEILIDIRKVYYTLSPSHMSEVAWTDGERYVKLEAALYKKLGQLFEELGYEVDSHDIFAAIKADKRRLSQERFKKAGATTAVDSMVKDYTTRMSPANIKSAIMEKLKKKGYSDQEIETMVIETQQHGRAFVNIGGDWGYITILFSDIRGIPVIETSNLRGDRR